VLLRSLRRTVSVLAGRPKRVTFRENGVHE
jgi:hypothetical protein